jgi:ABC-type transport system involved in cytochrome bd biosynthesis fused ATPase/permease subunit
MNKSFGGYNNKFFYIEAGVVLSSLLFVSSDISQFYWLIFFVLCISFVVLYTTRWLNGVIFNKNQDEVIIILRQAFFHKVHHINYSQISRVVFKNFSYTSPSNL